MEREREEYISQLIGRERLQLAGVREITEFDHTQIVADSDLGMVEVRGNNLKVTELDMEAKLLIVEGQINSFMFNDKRSREKGHRLLKKLIG
ncbi:MAG: YabP/YqfC family sporulation protein [Peptococcaceae bacterium]|nr:YabP/YqfC family sporulation protein [Peptococcaceae bacterium]